ncbi:hypothetical protein BKA69DRAFT_1080899 [Paraphysoderma sedebokerense]|nr:hypothetical protein BKA69DRAFT_1080899 [Paraphysoderma sedebokerense]
MEFVTHLQSLPNSTASDVTAKPNSTAATACGIVFYKSSCTKDIYATICTTYNTTNSANSPSHLIHISSKRIFLTTSYSPYGATIELDLSHSNPPISLLSFPPTYHQFFASLNLTHLHLNNNNLSVFPNSITFLHNLLELNLSFNSLKLLPTTIGSLKKLKELHLVGNQLEELPGVPGLGECRELKVIDVSRNNLKWVPGELKNCEVLRSLWVDGNSFDELLGTQKQFNSNTGNKDGTNTRAGSETDSSPKQAMQSLKDMCIQVAARHMKKNGLHVYCHHANSDICVASPTTSPATPEALSKDERRILHRLRKQLVDIVGYSHPNLPDAENLMFKILTENEEIDFTELSITLATMNGLSDSYSNQKNSEDIRKIVSSVDQDSSEVDKKFAEVVWRKVKNGEIESMLRLWKVTGKVIVVEGDIKNGNNDTSPISDWLMNQNTNSPSPPLSTASANAGLRSASSFDSPSKLSIDIKLANQLSVPFAPPTPKSAKSTVSAISNATTTSFQFSMNSPLSIYSTPTPSTPSPPSAFSTYCILQILPPVHLLRLLVSTRSCSVCEEGVYGFPGILVSRIQKVAESIVPVGWLVCSIECRDKLNVMLDGKPNGNRKIEKVSRVASGSIKRSRSRTM